MTRDVFGGHDYLPSVFDRWVSDPLARFQAAEVDDDLVAVLRLHPLPGPVMLLEGMRVAPGWRRQGVARRLLQLAVEEARRSGCSEVRMVTGSEAPLRLAASEGFRLVGRVAPWTAGALEGGELPSMVFPEGVEAAWQNLNADPCLKAYGGINPDWSEPLDLGRELLARLAEAGRVRQGPGARALAISPDSWGDRLDVSFVSGRGGALEELLMQLRYESDARGLAGVHLLAPSDHPGAASFRRVGYDLADESWRVAVHGLKI